MVNDWPKECDILKLTGAGRRLQEQSGDLQTGLRGWLVTKEYNGWINELSTSLVTNDNKWKSMNGID